MTAFAKIGDTFVPVPPSHKDIYKVLPPSNYTVNVDDQGKFFLSVAAPFDMPKKFYGPVAPRVGRIMHSFMERSGTTGVLLVGEKGSGKSMLAKAVSAEAQKADIPTLLIGAPYAGDGFNAFLRDIDQPTIVLIDEFEKVYNMEKGQQEHLLTLLDGVYTSKKLFLLTCNDRFKIDKHMKNRPGRIFYALDFGSLLAEEIGGYCKDKLKNQEHAAGVMEFAAFFRAFNFDMLQALVEEMNRYGETAQQAGKWLNARPSNEISSGCFTLRATAPDGFELIIDQRTHWYGMPFEDSHRVLDQTSLELIDIRTPDPARRKKLAKMKEDGELNFNAWEDDEVPPDEKTRRSLAVRTVQSFRPEQFDRAKSKGGSLAYTNPNGFTLYFTPQVRASYLDY